MTYTRRYKVECCICREWKADHENRWYVPSSDERRTQYQHHPRGLSHGYCLTCLPLFEKDMKRKEGITLEHHVDNTSKQPGNESDSK